MGEVEGEIEGEAEIVIGDADVDAEADALADDEGEAELDVVTVIETVIEGVDVYVGDAVVDAEAPSKSVDVAVADALDVGTGVTGSHAAFWGGSTTPRKTELVGAVASSDVAVLPVSCMYRLVGVTANNTNAPVAGLARPAMEYTDAVVATEMESVTDHTPPPDCVAWRMLAVAIELSSAM